MKLTKKVIQNNDECSLNINKSGVGFLIAGDMIGFCMFFIQSNGIVTIVLESGLFSNSDIPNKVCVYNEDNLVKIKNNTGADMCVGFWFKSYIGCL